METIICRYCKKSFEISQALADQMSEEEKRHREEEILQARGEERKRAEQKLREEIQLKSDSARQRQVGKSPDRDFGALSICMIILTIFQTIVGIILIIAIILQMQGSGLSTAFGGAGEFYRSKRSIEKLLVYATTVLAILFGVLSIILLFPH